MTLCIVLCPICIVLWGRSLQATRTTTSRVAVGGTAGFLVSMPQVPCIVSSLLIHRTIAFNYSLLVKWVEQRSQATVFSRISPSILPLGSLWIRMVIYLSLRSRIVGLFRSLSISVDILSDVGVRVVILISWIDHHIFNFILLVIVWSLIRTTVESQSFFCRAIHVVKVCETLTAPLVSLRVWGGA